METEQMNEFLSDPLGDIILDNGITTNRARLLKFANSIDTSWKHTIDKFRKNYLANELGYGTKKGYMGGSKGIINLSASHTGFVSTGSECYTLSFNYSHRCRTYTDF